MTEVDCASAIRIMNGMGWDGMLDGTCLPTHPLLTLASPDAIFLHPMLTDQSTSPFVLCFCLYRPRKRQPHRWCYAAAPAPCLYRLSHSLGRPLSLIPHLSSLPSPLTPGLQPLMMLLSSFFQPSSISALPTTRSLGLFDANKPRHVPHAVVASLV